MPILLCVDMGHPYISRMKSLTVWQTISRVTGLPEMTDWQQPPTGIGVTTAIRAPGAHASHVILQKGASFLQHTYPQLRHSGNGNLMIFPKEIKIILRKCEPCKLRRNPQYSTAATWIFNTDQDKRCKVEILTFPAENKNILARMTVTGAYHCLGK